MQRGIIPPFCLIFKIFSMGIFDSILSVDCNLAAPRFFGGNSGYVGYSKSKRASAAEESGYRNKSQMDSNFAKEVNFLLKSRVPNHRKILLSEIKKALDAIEPTEWHHTSKYGNKTNYYSPYDVAFYFYSYPVISENESIRKQIESNLKSVFKRLPKKIIQEKEWGIPPLEDMNDFVLYQIKKPDGRIEFPNLYDIKISDGYIVWDSSKLPSILIPKKFFTATDIRWQRTKKFINYLSKIANFDFLSAVDKINYNLSKIEQMKIQF